MATTSDCGTDDGVGSCDCAGPGCRSQNSKAQGGGSGLDPGCARIGGGQGAGSLARVDHCDDLGRACMPVCVAASPWLLDKGQDGGRAGTSDTRDERVYGCQFSARCAHTYPH